MARQRKRWIVSPSQRASHPAVDAVLKAEVEAKARQLIESVLKPKYLKPPPQNTHCNYITDLTLKWHGSSLYLVAVYTCPGPNALSPSFEARFARLRHAGSGRF